MKTVVGLFDDQSEAQRVHDALSSGGFSGSEVTMLTNGSSSTSTLQSLASNIPDSDLRFYQQGVQQGGALVVVRVDDNRADDAADIMSQFNMVDVDARVAQMRQTGSDVSVRDFNEGDRVLPVIEENLAVGKRAVERGRMRVYSTVVETPVEEQVTLREEHVHVERHPVNREVTSADAAAAFQEQSFELREVSEEAVVSKQARVVEEVVIGKESSERTETVRDTVRRTDVNVEEMSGSGVSSDTTTTGTARTSSSTTGMTSRSAGSGFESYENDYRTYYTSNLANSGYTYDQLSPVYRYGYDLANDSRYSGRDWSSFETDARTSWEDRNPGTWEQFKDTVRYAWDKARGTR